MPQSVNMYHSSVGVFLINASFFLISHHRAEKPVGNVAHAGYIDRYSRLASAYIDWKIQSIRQSLCSVAKIDCKVVREQNREESKWFIGPFAVLVQRGCNDANKNATT